MANATKMREITKAELNKKLRDGRQFELLNVLGPEDYKLGVIRGSRKIPLAELETRFTELDKGKEVVTYCANKGCDASSKAAELLSAKGFKASVYRGGAEEWAAAGLPLETAAAKDSATVEAEGSAKMVDEGCCSKGTGAKD